MSPVLSLDRALVESLGWTLVHFLWQGALVALALAALLAVLPGRGSRARHDATLLALLALLMMPAATFAVLLPSSSSPACTAGSVPCAPSPASALTGLAEISLPAAAPEPRALAVGIGTRAALRPLLPAIAALWLLGVSLFSVRAVRAWLFARRLGRETLEPVPAPWGARVAELACEIGLRQAVRVAGSRLAEVPMVVGWLRPLLLVPVSCWTGLAPAQLEALLLHELAHIRRRDAWIATLQVLLETLLFYHPAVWWVSARLREEREHCCDDLAVATGGSAIGYARGLFELERLRQSPALLDERGLALAADGSSSARQLEGRVRRLLGAPPRPRSLGWVSGLALAGAVVFGLSCWRLDAATPPILDGPNAEGTWKAETKSGQSRLELDLRYRTDASGLSIHGDEYERSDFAGLDEALASGSPEVQFQLVRDAGTLAFSGRFDGARGSGTFRFQPNESYADGLVALGLRRPPFVVQMQLALFNVELATVRELDALGYEELSYDELVSMHIHGVSLDFIRRIQERGFPRPSIEELVSMRIHGVSLELIDQLAKMGYTRLSTDDLVTMQIHGVSPALLAEMAALGYEKPDIDDVISLKIHGFTPEWLRELGALGYRSVPIDDLVSMRIHGITPAFIGEIEALGYDDLAPATLINFKIHGVTPELIRSELESRRHPPSAEELIDEKIHGRLGD